jgi:hypothetical protein
MKNVVVLFLCIVCALSACSQSDGLTVVLIRHGEKDDATGNLSCKGLHRALLLPNVLNSKFPKPSYIYVPSVTSGKSTGHARMFQTITPFAIQNSLSIDSKFGETDDDGVALEVMKKTGLVLLVWEHQNIPRIANALGVKDKHLKWDDSDFDSIWIIKYAYSEKGKLKASLTVGSEGLKPPESCVF